jgi:serine protease Do
VDIEGRLIGINTFILSQSGGNEGLGFAIPGATVRNVFQQLRTKDHVDRGDVGIWFQEITPVLAKGLSLARQDGVVVADVRPEGPAEMAGLKTADIILTADRIPSESVRQFQNIVYRRQPGDKLNVHAQRGANTFEIMLEVKARSPQSDPLAGLASSRHNFVRRFGVFCLEVDKQVAAMLPGPRLQYGLVVAAKVPAARANLWISRWVM